MFRIPPKSPLTLVGMVSKTTYLALGCKENIHDWVIRTIFVHLQSKILKVLLCYMSSILFHVDAVLASLPNLFLSLPSTNVTQLLGVC